MTATDEQLRALADHALSASMSHGTAALAAWGLYIADVRDVVNHFRGLEIADMIYLHNYRLRQVVEELAVHEQSITHQAVNHWLTAYGPTQYFTVARTGNTYKLLTVPVTGIVQTRRELAAMADAGRRIAPARWEIGEDADARELWQRLGPDES